MSFRELRSFTEIMRALGYPRLISMENFRLPNFELVTDCLYWLVQRYYPGVDISDEISTEADRVKFLQSVAQVMLTKARMKLNIKKLYAADMVAVRELLKVASLLYKATEKAQDGDEDAGEVVDFSMVLKGFNPKEIKQQASDIIKAGAALFDALAQEPELREYRARAVAGHVDTDFVERGIQEAITRIEDDVRVHEEDLVNLEQNERTLDSKIEKKKQELERVEKRLGTLQTVRPTWMDEFERLQTELNGLYGQYLDRFRNLEFLENELEAYYQAEQEKMEAQDRRLKKMQKRLAAEELRILRGEEHVHEDNLRLNETDESDADGEEEDDDDLGSEPDDQGPVGGGGRGGGGYGAMNGGGVPRGGGGAAPGQIKGSLGAFDDDEASIEDDDNSDGGEVSLAGSEGGRPNGGGGGGAPPGYGAAPAYGGGYGGAEMGDEPPMIEDDDEEDDF